GGGIREIVSLIAHSQLDRPAALAGDAPDIVAAGNVRLEIDMLALNRPAKSEHRTRVIECVNVQGTISRAGRAGDRVAGQFRGRSWNHLDRERNMEWLDLSEIHRRVPSCL